jgi:hypothetical protein
MSIGSEGAHPRSRVAGIEKDVMKFLIVNLKGFQTKT